VRGQTGQKSTASIGLLLEEKPEQIRKTGREAVREQAGKRSVRTLLARPECPAGILFRKSPKIKQLVMEEKTLPQNRAGGMPAAETGKVVIDDWK
jgi:hypothetical protein